MIKVNLNCKQKENLPNKCFLKNFQNKRLKFNNRFNK